MDVLDVNLAAVADPGQIVVLRATRPLARDQMLELKEILSIQAHRVGVKLILLNENLEVAQIKDAD